MVTENIKAFFETLSQDESLQQALKEKELAYTGSKEDREAVVEAVVIPVAEEAGYDFTLEELKEFEKGMQVEGELAENELESVAGGATSTWGACIFVGVGWGSGCRVVGVGLCGVYGCSGTIDMG